MAKATIHQASFVLLRDLLSSDWDYEEFSQMISDDFTWGDVDHALVSAPDLQRVIEVQTKHFTIGSESARILHDLYIEIDALPLGTFISL